MSDSFCAQVNLFAGPNSPKNWMKCDGSLLPIQTYPQLFSLIGTNFGGDGEKTFGLPNMEPLDKVNYLINTFPNEIGEEAHQVEGSLGEIILLATDFAPEGWMKCEGQTLEISRYPKLFEILGTSNGGDGKETFNLPTIIAPNEHMNHLICVSGGESIVENDQLVMPGTVGSIEYFNTSIPLKKAKWGKADGTAMLIRGNEALFTIIGTTYGGNGTTEFNLPKVSTGVKNVFATICIEGEYPITD